ncbi:MAG: lipocalin family protein [Candidatus Bipolaricaulaceae bacterium]
MGQWWLLAVVGALAVGLIIAGRGPPDPGPEVVDHVDLAAYTGTWYELASIPAWFQRDCARGTTATYTLLADGRIEVLNRCYDAGGALRSATGRAWVADPAVGAKLKVSFFSVLGLWLFPADYWIIDLAPDYSYAVVGHPTREYGWILSRTPQLAPETMAQIIARLEENGYDYTKFRPTPQED